MSGYAPPTPAQVGGTPLASRTSLSPNVFGTSTTTPFSVSLIGVDASGRMYATSGGGIVQSDDNLVSISSNKGLPGTSSYLYANKILEFKGALYLLAVDGTTGYGAVYTAARQPGNTAFSWTKVLDQGTGANNTIGTGLSADGTYLYCSEYGDPSGGPKVYRSSDGTTWTTIYGPLAVRHVHAVAPNPYVAGEVWLTTGDGGITIHRSTDYGTTWAVVSSNANWQAVQISFSPGYVWFGGDNRMSTAHVYDQAAGVLRVAFPNCHAFLSLPGARPRGGAMTPTDLTFTSTSKTVTSATAAWTADDRGRVIYSDYLPSRRSWIVTVNNGTTITVFDAATATSSGNATAYLGSEAFYGVAYFGAVNPSDGSYWCIAMDASGPGMRPAFFRSPGLGEPLYLVDVLPVDPGWRFKHLVFAGGYVWSGPWRCPLF